MIVDFDTQINRKYVNLKTYLQAAHAHRYITVRYDTGEVEDGL